MNQGFDLASAAVLAALIAPGCSSPLTTREKGGLIGGFAGAGAGAAIIGSTVGAMPRSEH